MQNLTITDLSHTAQLDGKAMAAVHGGMHKGFYSYAYGPLVDGSKHDFSVVASQLNAQTQNIGNNNGVNAAFVKGVSSTITPTQAAANSISF